MLSRTHILAIALSTAITTFAFAGPKQDVLSAYDKLQDASNYSWNIQITDFFDHGKTITRAPIFGKAQHNGVTIVCWTIMDSTFMAILKGQHVVVKMPAGWEAASQLSSVLAHPTTSPTTLEIDSMFAQNARDLTPQIRLADDMHHLNTMRVTEGGYQAEYTKGEVCQILEQFVQQTPSEREAGRPQGHVLKATSGSTRYWINQDGVLTRVQTHIVGLATYDVPKNPDRDIDRITDITFSKIGSTDIQVPADAAATLAK